MKTSLPRLMIISFLLFLSSPAGKVTATAYPELSQIYRMLGDDPAASFLLKSQNTPEKIRTARETLKGPIKKPVIEFRKISPVKYRIIAHGVTGGFPLIFSESFHTGWKLYPKAPAAGLPIGPEWQKTLDAYTPFKGNERDQASREEVSDFILKGWISTIGSGKESTRPIHELNQTGQRVPSQEESYTIDFISKNFNGTVQNDNLSEGGAGETWFASHLPERFHLKANDYANLWVIDPSYIRKNFKEAIVTEKDGSRTIFFVAEFWPQRIFYLFMTVSALTFLSCIFFAARTLLLPMKKGYKR